MNDRIKGFIFDIDGVLTDTSEYHYMAWKLLASKINIYIDREVNEELKGVSRMEALDVILKHGNKEDYYTQAEKLTLAMSKNKHYLEMISRFTSDNLLPGVLELFTELKALGIKIGTVSGTKSGGRLIDLLDIRKQVDYIVETSAPQGKPEMEIFLKACEGLGLKPFQCVGVEKTRDGIIAVKKAGMFAIGIGQPSSLEEADLVVKSIQDISLSLIFNG